MFNLDLYEEGVEVGIERGQYLLLIKLLTIKLGNISDKYINKIEDLEINQIINIALNVFNIKTIEDLNKYFV